MRGLATIADLFSQSQDAVTRRWRTRTQPYEWLQVVVDALAKREPILARIFRDSTLSSWLRASSATVPRWFRFRPPSGPPSDFRFAAVGGARPPIHFPALDHAAQNLISRQIFTADQLLELDQDARRTAFTIARVASTNAISKARNVLVEHITRGGDLRGFNEDLRDDLRGALSPSQIETVYRTQIMQAYSTGQRATLESPMVRDHFPYLMWSATHDSRTRPDHLAMERHGQNGTAVYRADDPLWRILYPPAGWQCRCHVIPLTIEAAANYGSHEAAKWLATGIPPEVPTFAVVPYPIIPPRDWPRHDRIAAVVAA